MRSSQWAPLFFPAKRQYCHMKPSSVLIWCSLVLKFDADGVFRERPLFFRALSQSSSSQIAYRYMQGATSDKHGFHHHEDSHSFALAAKAAFSAHEPLKGYLHTVHIQQSILGLLQCLSQAQPFIQLGGITDGRHEVARSLRRASLRLAYCN